ncbi:hypothetical protein ATANTOWER_026517 [Ataeniobius toweri]|uniref:Uncharacterized protein n=1 Tax=Ataeniobius toweri TaxID=208326 RepID=A0ABU7AA61_9TELE|nr:hypothetical protein [Ataeniobius toweri]
MGGPIGAGFLAKMVHSSHMAKVLMLDRVAQRSVGDGRRDSGPTTVEAIQLICQVRILLRVGGMAPEIGRGTGRPGTN